MHPSAPEQPADSAGDASGRVSLERLRERTDELELLISGLSLVGLIQLAHWIGENVGRATLQMPTYAAPALVVPLALILFCYLIASGFALHLLLRGGWVALIGLKTVFPDGIRWERAFGIGPLLQERLMAALPLLDEPLGRLDRLATVLFASTLWLGLVLLWLSFLLTVMLLPILVAMAYSVEPGSLRVFVGLFGLQLLTAALVAPPLLWLFDTLLARWLPRLRRWRWYRGWVRFLAAIVQAVYPWRLFALPRLTLQTNTRPLPVLVVLVLLGIFGARPFLDGTLDRFGGMTWLYPQELDDGYRSTHFESQLQTSDFDGQPLVPAPVIEGDWLPLLLPYVPLRDDRALDRYCKERLPRQPASFWDSDHDPPADADRAADQARGAVACLSQLWELRLNGRRLPLDAFMTAERSDLGVRGLYGYLDLRAEAPGPQRLEVYRQPRLVEKKQEEAENSEDQPKRYLIPFLWSPDRAD